MNSYQKIIFSFMTIGLVGCTTPVGYNESLTSNAHQNIQTSHPDSAMRINSIVGAIVSSSGVTQNELTRYLHEESASSTDVQSLLRAIDSSAETAQTQLDVLESFNPSDAYRDNVEQLHEQIIRYLAICELLKEDISSGSKEVLETSASEYANCVRAISQFMTSF